MRTVVIFSILVLLPGLSVRGQEALGQGPLAKYWAHLEAHHPGLQAAEHRFRARMEVIAQARAWPDPQFSVGVFLRSVETRLGPQQARFSLQQAVPWWGELRAKGEAATHEAEAAWEAYRLLRARLLRQLQQAYYPLYRQARQAEWQHEYIERLAARRDRVLDGLGQGGDRRIDVVRLELALAEARKDSLVLASEGRALRRAFNTLAQRPVSAGIALPDSLPQEVERPLWVSRDSLAGHPAVRIEEKKAEAQKALYRAAGWGRWPRLSVGVDYVLIGRRSDMDLPDNGSNALMPMLSVSLPLWQKDDRARVQQRQREARAAEASARAALLDLETSLAKVKHLMAAAQAKLELHQAQEELSREGLRLLERDLAQGRGGYEDLLEMEAEVLRHRQAAAGALSDYWVARAAWGYLLTGNSLNED